MTYRKVQNICGPEGEIILAEIILAVPNCPPTGSTKAVWYRQYYYRENFSLGQVPKGPLAQSAVSANILPMTVPT
jgi:hypothetical protein